MRERFDLPAAPAFALGVVLFTGNIGALVYGLAAVAPSRGFMLLYTLALALAIAWWVQADAARRGLPTATDFGFLTFFAWPAVLTWHLEDDNRLAGVAVVITFAVIPREDAGSPSHVAGGFLGVFAPRNDSVADRFACGKRVLRFAQDDRPIALT